MDPASSKLILGLQCAYLRFRVDLWEQANADVNDRAKLRALIPRAKELAAQLSDFNDRLGDRATPRLRKLEREFSDDADLFIELVNADDPETIDLDEMWRNHESCK